MDHKQLINSLSHEQRQQLLTKSNARGLTHLAVHAGGIVLLGAMIFARVPFWQVLMVGQGIAIIFLFTLLHEAIHRTPFQSNWLNDSVAHICGFLILIPARWFRFFHFAHHRHTQDPEKDPELATPKPQTLVEYGVHISGIPVWWSLIRTLFEHAAGKSDEDYVPASATQSVVNEARVYLASYVFLLLGSLLSSQWFLLFVWVLPVILGQPFLRFYLLAEHGLCPTVANMLENSRTTFTNSIIRRLAWNMPYHAEHHAWPTVPFHKLPEFHEITKVHLKVTEQGYGQFNKSYVDQLDA